MAKDMARTKKKARAEKAENRRSLNATGNKQVVTPVSEISQLVITIIGEDSSIGMGPEESTIGTIEEIYLHESQSNHPTYAIQTSTTCQPCSPSDLTITYSPPTHDPHLDVTAAISPTRAPATTLVHAPARAQARTPAPRTPQAPIHAPASGGAQRPIRRIRAHTHAEQFKNLHVSQIDIMKELVLELKESNNLKMQLLLEHKEQNGLLRDMIKEIKNNTGSSSQTETEGFEASTSEMQVEEQAAVASPLSCECEPECADASASQVIAPRVLPLSKPIRLSTKQIKCGKIEVVKLKDGTVVLQKKK